MKALARSCAKAACSFLKTRTGLGYMRNDRLSWWRYEHEDSMAVVALTCWRHAGMRGLAVTQVYPSEDCAAPEDTIRLFRTYVLSDADISIPIQLGAESWWPSLSFSLLGLTRL